MGEIPGADWSWIHSTADRFEQAWKKDPRPRIEDYLAEVDAMAYSGRPLLEELLRVECERAADGTTARCWRRTFVGGFPTTVMLSLRSSTAGPSAPR